VLNGVKILVEWAHVADELIVLARTGGDGAVTAFIVPRDAEGVTIRPMATIAEGKRSEVVFENAVVPAHRALGPVGNGWSALKAARQRAIIAKSAELVGMAAVAHAISVDYAKSRVAFGRPIGAFQAIQHKLVEMQNSLDGARLATYYAAWLLDQGKEDDYFISLAKAQASEAARIVCFEGHEIHAGIGFMREYDLQLYYRRAKVAELEFGDARAHRLMLAQMLREGSAVGRI
jgi:alkylation response protein AidB-like acyl-CoA dehydrogenase